MVGSPAGKDVAVAVRRLMRFTPWLTCGCRGGSLLLAFSHFRRLCGIVEKKHGPISKEAWFKSLFRSNAALLTPGSFLARFGFLTSRMITSYICAVSSH